jgi:3-mercaptopropionate dioxygenase
MSSAVDFPSSGKLAQFVQVVNNTLLITQQEAKLLAALKPALQALLAQDDWLPASHALYDPDRYQQHPLYIDPQGRFSVVSFVWGPGHKTPVHDHTVWGMVGVLRGAELCQHYVAGPQGWQPDGDAHVVGAGEVDLVSPALGDVHVVSNALADGITVSIHVYGANIGQVRRHVFTPGTHTSGEFISGYSSVPVLMSA